MTTVHDELNSIGNGSDARKASEVIEQWLQRRPAENHGDQVLLDMCNMLKTIWQNQSVRNDATAMSILRGMAAEQDMAAIMKALDRLEERLRGVNRTGQRAAMFPARRGRAARTLLRL